MIAWLDALIPPLDPALGFWLLLAIAVECVAVWIYRRGRQHVNGPPDPLADVHGDVTLIHATPKGDARARHHVQA